MELSFINIWIFSNNLFVVKGERSFNFSSLTSTRSPWVFPSPFNLNILTVNCTTETEGIRLGKALLNPLVPPWSVSFEFSFYGGETRSTDAITGNKRTNSHNFKIKIWLYLQLLSSPFIQWTEINLRTWINLRWEWILLFVRSLTVFKENIAVTVLAKLVWLFFKSVHAHYFFLRAL